MITLTQLIRFSSDVINSSTDREFLRNLRKDIEKLTDEAELNNLDDSYQKRLEKVDEYQTRYKALTGFYYHYGGYNGRRR